MTRTIIAWSILMIIVEIHCCSGELAATINSFCQVLPPQENATKVNQCGPMNREGIACSECIDGYGPSVTSPTSDVLTVQKLGMVSHSTCYWN